MHNFKSHLSGMIKICVSAAVSLGCTSVNNEQHTNFCSSHKTDFFPLKDWHSLRLDRVVGVSSMVAAMVYVLSAASCELLLPHYTLEPEQGMDMVVSGDWWCWPTDS